MNIFSELLQDLQAARPVCLVTLASAPLEFRHCLGAQLLLYPGGEVRGCIVDELLTRSIVNKLATESWSQARLFQIEECPGFEFFWDMPAAKRRILIFGAGHISQPLVEILALVGYSVTVADDRPDFANKTRFPQAERVFCGSFSEAFGSLPISRSTGVVIVTRGHLHDLACLRHALGSPAFYIGMIGSRRKVGLMFDSLKAEGVSGKVIGQVFAPIGLDLHAQTPAEIALSIAAEILAVEKGGSGSSLCRLSRREKRD